MLLFTVITSEPISKKFRNWCAYTIALFCFVLAGIRSDEYPDHAVYSAVFNEIRSNSIFSDEIQAIPIEFGFKLISKLISFISISNYFIFLLYSITSFILLCLINKKLKLDFFILFFIYFSTSFLTKDLGAIRFSISCLLVVYFIVSIKNLNGWLAYFINFLSFQSLSVISGFILIFKTEKISTFSIVIFLLISSLFLFFFLDFNIISHLFYPLEKIQRYTDTTYVKNNEINLYPAIIRSLFLTIFIYIINRKKLDSDLVLMCNTLLLSFIFYISFYNIPILSQRFGGYFMAIDAFALAKLNVIYHKLIVKLFIILYSFASFFYIIYTTSYLQQPYTFSLN